MSIPLHSQGVGGPSASAGRVIVVGASAGGLEALGVLLAGLPADLDAPVCVVMHTSPHGPGRAPRVLARASRLPVAHATDIEPLEAGRVYVAPPDHHLVVEPRILRLTRGPRENRQRPAVDTLFRSAAYVYGPQVIGVILSGALDDGTAGLWTVKDRGGIAVVQDPAEATFPSMPQSAIEYVAVDHVAPLAELGPLLARLVAHSPPSRGAAPVSRELEALTQIAKGDSAIDRGLFELGPTTPFTCPECAGVLVRLREGGVPTFRCHTGHAFSLDTLMSAASEHTEEILWNALRGLDEMRLLLEHAAQHARERRESVEADAADGRARDAQRQSEVLRAVVMAHQQLARENLQRRDSGAAGAPDDTRRSA